jgi:hypothetical protein
MLISPNGTQSENRNYNIDMDEGCVDECFLSINSQVAGDSLRSLPSLIFDHKPNITAFTALRTDPSRASCFPSLPFPCKRPWTSTSVG